MSSTSKSSFVLREAATAYYRSSRTQSPSLVACGKMTRDDDMVELTETKYTENLRFDESSSSFLPFREAFLGEGRKSHVAH